MVEKNNKEFARTWFYKGCAYIESCEGKPYDESLQEMENNQHLACDEFETAWNHHVKKNK